MNFWQGLTEKQLIQLFYGSDEDSMGGQKQVRASLTKILLEKAGKELILDIGCGLGLTYKWLKALTPGVKYFGVDSNANAVHYCMKKYGTFFSQGAIEKIPFKDKSAFLVTSKDVLEHLPEFKPGIDELFRVASKYVVLSFFHGLSESKPRIYQHPDGYYLNTYNRDDVVNHCAGLGAIAVEEYNIQDVNGTETILVCEVES